MNRDELLTKLAMELGEWPKDTTTLDQLLKPCWHLSKYKGVIQEGGMRPIICGWKISRKDWLAERESLINKPSWDDVSEFANYMAQMPNGDWLGFYQKPIQGSYGWVDGKAVGSSIRGAIPAGHDWQNTLEPRPVDATPEEDEAWSAFDESRIDRIAQSDGSGDHYGVSDGSTASYYELPEGASELQDLISYRNMNAQDGEVFRAIYRKGRASHSDELRDAKKVLFYARAEVERLEKLK